MTQIPAYGGWRERRGFGLGTLTGPQTAIGLALVLACLGSVLLMPALLPVFAAPAAATFAALGIRVRGETVAGVASRHLRWRVARRSGATRFTSTDSVLLPGVLAGLEVHHMNGLALVHDRRARTVTALVPVEPVGIEFMDPSDIHTWMAGWGDWLAHLGYVDGLCHVQVTVHSAPAVEGPARVPAGTVAARVLAQVGAHANTVRTRTHVTVTLRAPHDLEAAGADMADVIAGMDALNRCGMAVLDPLSVADLTAWVRSCYDPYIEHGTSEQWRDARPTATQESWDTYQHDSGLSTAFMWDDCPGESVSPATLTKLLGPADYVKRVCLVFEPMPAHEAAREVDRQTQAATFHSQYRRRIGRDETARDRLDMQRAQQTAQEQARGSGLVDVGMYAVVTAPDRQRLREAATDLHNRAGEARIRLRRAYGAQAQCFAVTLGLGYLPSRGW